ncbi:dihydrolipoyllysine-residue acetyltransferase [Halorhodospira halophila]|uniref:Acetyltransferase component of pyruvate dehydrogenase complex n=1 Tax=Halorhodospira halophila (strain DSM 244 / SL1) TaxID=349124 RepID=A1WVV0_HALHL|nr:dihydrolipoyllysine-residue acetyltransferase [Halorhodospira halophila]ABM61812.1 pyruvate dehydrogenase complex dihydrolipoamide acetyltransferase [Halorhodospira halophila SL1]MBK1728860.1 dihydrolipoyllysine-residue acetyltransferase [Halorhodospira halophila]
MAEQELKVPDIGGFEEVEVIEVLVAPGDRIEAEQSLITLESDKASMEVPAEVGGEIRAVHVAVGDTVSEGSVVATVDPVAEPAEPATQAEAPAAAGGPAEETAPSADGGAPATAAPAAAAQPAASAGSGGGAAAGGVDESPAIDRDGHRAAHASPSVRRYARELGVDLSRVQGSGRKGRIRREDVEAYVKQVMQGQEAPPAGAAGAPAAEGAGIPPIPEQDFSRFGEVERVPLTRIQRLSGPHLHRSWLNVPHVTQFDEADITEMEAFRQSLKKEAEARGVKLTPLAFLVRAAAAALAEYPRFNASLSADGQELILKHYCHIGVAVDTPEGLVVPVLRDADQKGVLQIAEDLGTLSAKARDGKLGPADMQGGCFSISSLGGIGGTAFTPIVNAPEVAILGVSRSQTRPVWDGQTFQPRLMLPLSLSYDHRVIDGAMAARFTNYLSQVLGDLRRLVL